MKKMEMKPIERNPEDYDILTSPPIKLKNYPAHRKFQMIDLEKQFGRIPELIVIEKVRETNNCFVIRAFVKKLVGKIKGK